MTLFRDLAAALLLLAVAAAAAPELAIVTPVHEDNFAAARRFIRSVDLFCEDCVAPRVALRFVVAHDEKEAFQGHMSDYAFDRKNISIVTVEEAVAQAGFEPPEGINAFLRLQTGTKHLFQGVKKVFGCLSTGAPACFVTDSSSFMVRKAAMLQVASAYFAKRVVLHNSKYVPGCGHAVGDARHNEAECAGRPAAATQMTRFMLGPGCEASIKEMGWAEENYHWFWARGDLLAYLEFTRKLNTSMLQLVDRYTDDSKFDDPVGIWYEESFYQYLHCVRGRNETAEHAFVDTAALAAELVGAGTRDELFGITGDAAFLEHSGRHMGAIHKASPMFLPKLADALAGYGVPTYALGGHTGRNAKGVKVAFMRRANITWCTSFCTEDIWLDVNE